MVDLVDRRIDGLLPGNTMKHRMFSMFFLLGCLSVGHTKDIAATTHIGHGTSGSALHVSLPLSDRVNLRIGFQHALKEASLNLPFSSSQANHLAMTSKQQSDNYETLLDWFPWGNYFRLTLGAIVTDMTTLTLIRPTYSVPQLPGEIRDTALMVHQRAPLQIAPYIGIGLGIPGGRSYRKALSLEVGLALHRSSAMSAKNNCTSQRQALCTQIQKTLQDNARDIDTHFYSARQLVTRIGLIYRF